MQSVFGLLYITLFMSYIATALFIVFHISRYSLKRSSMLLGLALFLVVFGVLLLTNALIFFSLPLNEIAPQSF